MNMLIAHPYSLNLPTGVASRAGNAYKKAAGLTLVAVIGFASSGTGIESESERCREDRGGALRLGRYCDAVPIAAEHVQSEVGTTLDRIKSIFGANVSQLADWFGVSRQTIYNWQKGEPIAIENQERLHELASAAEVFAREGTKVTGFVLRRKLFDGKSFVELIRGNEPVHEASIQLAELIRKEAARRKVIESRMAQGRARADAADYFTPTLDESEKD